MPCSTVFWAFSLLLVNLTGKNLAQLIIAILAPIFSASDSYIGLAIIAGAMGFFWFVGVQGPSIVAPAVSAIEVTNTAANLNLIQAGHQATHVLAQNAQDYVMNMGGTGSTFILVFLFLFLAKSKQLKALGKASFIPVSFSVNEPILFGAPIIMNPIFFIPFIGAPILNVWLFKIFVDYFGMNGFVFNLPWTTPGPIGLIMGVRFSIQAVILAVALIVMDVIVYYPFFKAYDTQKVQEEAKKAAEAEANGESGVETTDAVVATDAGDIPLGLTKDKKNLNILVICAGGGTSGILANALNKMAKEKDLPIEAAAAAYGAHGDLLPDMDVTVLAPQMDAMKDSLKKEADASNVKMITTSGKQYIDLTRHADKALSFIIDKLKGNDANQAEGDKK